MDNVSAVRTEKISKYTKNIYEVYQLMSFRCIMSLSYRAALFVRLFYKR